MILHLGKEWNETVLVNIGGKSASSKVYVPFTIHHGVYNEVEIITYFLFVICLVMSIYIIDKAYNLK